MKIEKLDANHIKITVDFTDLAMFNVDLRNLTPDSPSLTSFLFFIMKQAQNETGFNPYNGQVLIEAIPELNKVTFFVSRIDMQNKISTTGKYKYKGKTVKVVAKAIVKDAISISIDLLYRFDDFNSLSDALTLLEESYLEDSSIYKMDSFYYLFLTVNRSDVRAINTRLSEFSRRIASTSITNAHFAEYAKLLATNENVIKIARIHK